MSSAIAVTAGRAWGQRPNQAKLNRMGVMSLCFGSILKSTGRGGNDPNRKVDVLDLASMVAERYGIHYVELQHSHLASTEAGYLADFRSRLQKTKSKVNQINLELGQLNISTPDPARRLETIDQTKKWVDYAVAIGCPRIMVNQGSLAPEVRQTAIETLKTINVYAKSKKVFLTMENRGLGSSRTNPPGMIAPPPPRAGAPAGPPRQPSYSAPWEAVVEVIKASGIYANPDWLWFGDPESRAAGLPVMYRLTSGSSHCRLDPATFSSAECVKISKAAKYKGLFSIETARNNGPDPYVAVQSILDFALANI